MDKLRVIDSTTFRSPEGSTPAKTGNDMGSYYLTSDDGNMMVNRLF